MAYKYDMIRYSPHERVLKPGQKLTPCDFVTIASHDYQIFYHAGTHYGRLDFDTQCDVALENDALRFSLDLCEPNMDSVLEAVQKTDQDFWTTDFVALNFIDTDNEVVQVGLKLNGQVQLFRGYARVASEDIDAEITHTERGWYADVSVPLSLLGLNAEALNSSPLPFDLVRYHQANGSIGAWCPIPDQRPFHENYECPVFCFGLLTTGTINWEEYSGAASDIGSFTYAGPTEACAGEHIRFSVTYTAGKYGLEPGGAIRFIFHNEVIECNRRTPVYRRFPEKDWSDLQQTDPTAPGYLRASSSNSNVGVRVEKDKTFSMTAYLEGNQGLAPGETVTLEAGCDERGPGVRTQLLHQDEFPFKLFVDPLANGIFYTPEEWPVIDVVGGAAQALQLHSQPTPDPDESFRFVVTATDYYGNVASNYQGTIRFYGHDSFEGLPDEYTFGKKDRGIAVFDVSIPVAGQFLVRAMDVDTPRVYGTSNPIITDGSFGPGKIYFGDIHTHSQCSDGRLPLDQKYREVAHHRGCDFWGITDHAYDLTTERIEKTKQTLNAVNEDGRFVTIQGYEWTCTDGHGHACARTRYGHRNVHFRGDMEAAPDGISPLSDSPQNLVDSLNKLGQEYVIYNHFHCGDPTSFKDVDEGFEVSSWGGNKIRDTRQDKKKFPFGSITDVFDHDFRGAVVAASDHGTEAYYTGFPAELTAVRTTALTRDNVFDALKNGWTYGTTGQKVLLAFTVNDTPPGKNNPDVSDAVRNVRVTVASVMPITGIQIVKNGKTWQKLKPGNDLVQSFEKTDDEEDPESGYYYVRINTAQGHNTWSSPIFFNVKG